MQTFMFRITSFMVAIFTTGATAHIQVAVDAPASPSAPMRSTVELSTPPNAIVSARLLLFNTGTEGSVLHWEAMTSATGCAAPQPVRWLETEPAFGSLEGGHSTSVSVYASSFAASTGVRRGFLCIRGDTGADPPIEVPVALIVEGSVVAEPFTLSNNWRGKEAKRFDETGLTH
ncbi:MAG: hypothetical protein ABI843_10640 [Dokdonella sp.]